MGTHTSVLLPPSRVAVFARDAGLAQTLQALAEDWRFARVKLEVFSGDIQSAISDYGQAASPELVIVETGDISEAFIAKLGELAGVCAQGTDAVVIGPKNDVHLYRSLIGMGVRDYLVLPVDTADLVDVIAKTLLDKKGTASSALSVVIGGKGGVGTTAIAQSLAVLLSRDLGHKTLVTDAAGSSGTLGIAFGAEGGAGYAEVLRIAASGGGDDLGRLLHKASDTLRVLASGGDGMLADHGDADAFEKLLERLMQIYPQTVFDASAAAHAVQKRALTLASHITLVTAPLLPVLRNTRALLAEIRMLRGAAAPIDLVINMQGWAGGDDVPLRDIKAALDLDPAVTIAFQPKIFVQADANRQAVVDHAAAGDIKRQLLALAHRIAGDADGAAGATSGAPQSLGFLKKLIKK